MRDVLSYLTTVATSVKAGVVTALTMMGLGIEMFIGWIPDDIGKLALFLGCILSFIMIALQFTNLQIRRIEKQKLDDE